MPSVPRSARLIGVLFAYVAVGAVAQPPPRLGTLTFPATGKPEAHRAFLEGVMWLHSFGYEQALESFRAAEAIDPNFVMAYWGEAMTHNHPVWHTQDLGAGRAALAKLAATREARAAKAATARERDFLAAIEVLFGDGDKASRDRGYRDAMAGLAAKYPEDPEARCFYALSILGAVPLGERGAPAQLEAGAIAERVFAANPKHPGAAHIVIHAYDDPESASRALRAARAYALIAPDSSHARHMPAHIFMQLGMWDEAAASDEAAFAASSAWVARKRFPLAMRDFHSLGWWCYELLQQGRFAAARATFKPIDEAIGQASRGTPSSPHSSMPLHEPDAVGQPDVMSLRNDLATMRAFYVIESGDWAMLKGKTSFDNIDELFAVGLSAVKLGDLGRAKAADELITKFVATDQDEGRKPIAVVMQHELGAVIALAEGHTDVALRELGEATTMENRMRRPSARPHPIKPAHELLGETLLELGRAKDAVTAFERALWWAPNRSRAVLGLARALSKTGDSAAARKQYAQFLKNWTRGDAGREEVTEARRFLHP